MIERLSLSDVWTYAPPRYEDSRGWFSETFNAATLTQALEGVTFVQDNQSLSRAKGTLRGMHFQIGTKAQDKLVRVLRGSVQDVAVDLRRSSPTFGQWVSAVLSAQNGKQIFVPKGFAHGFLTLEPDTEVLYKVSDFYSRDHERGLAWDDAQIGVVWELPRGDIKMAERDSSFPLLADLPTTF